MTTPHPLDVWRKKKGWTQQRLAEAIGVTEATVSRLFAGYRSGLSKRASLNAFVVTSGTVDLKTLLLGAECDSSRSHPAKPARRASGAK